MADVTFPQRILAVNPSRHFSIDVPITGATFQDNRLIGATGIDLVIMAGLPIQPPFTFNSGTGTITMAVILGDKLFVAYH